MRLLISQQPGWSPLHKRRLHPTPRKEGNLGAEARGSLDPGSCSRIVLDCNGQKITSPRASRKLARRAALRDRRLLGLSKPRSLARRWQRARSAHQPQKGLSCCARRATRGVRSRFTPLPAAENAAGEGALPGRPLDQGTSQDRAEHVPRETRVTRGPAEALAASSNAASTDASRKSNDPLGARVRGQLQTLTRRIFPLGHGRPKGQQQTTG